MRKILEKSFPGRVMLMLSCSMTLSWMFTESVDFYYQYQRAQKEILEGVEWELNSVVSQEGIRFGQGAQQVRVLLNLWRGLPEVDRFSSISQSSPRTVFVPFDSSVSDPVRVRRAQQVLEVFGAGATQEHIDAFLILPDVGFVFYHPESRDLDYLRRKVLALSKLHSGRAIQGYEWGLPYIGPHGCNCVSVVRSLADGVMAGVSVRIGELAVANQEWLGHARFIMRDGSGLLIPGANAQSVLADTAPLLRGLPACRSSGARRVGDYYALCQWLPNPQWEIIALYPAKIAAINALSEFSVTVPLTLAAQLLLLLVVFVTLKRQLGRPLQHIVDIIDTFKPNEYNRRLPEERQDELGRIAKAYNTLLTTIATHYKTLERKVRERTRELDEAKRIAEQMSDRKSEHMSSISHEIRTPLNGIAGALELLERGSLSLDQKELVATAKLSSSHLLKIVNNLLDLSRIEAGQLQLSLSQTDLLSLLDEAMLTVSVPAQEKQLTLRTLVAADVPLEVRMDALRVSQILINLLGNAIKFTAQGEVKLRVARRGERLEFEVEDSGQGIALERQLDIFKPFVQASAHSSGSGLGLAIASRLAGLMGGEILLDSMENKGSRFTLLLSLEQGHSSPRGTGEIKAPILLHPQLKEWGWTPLEADNPLLVEPELAWLPGRLWRRLEGESVTTTGVIVSPWSLQVLLVDDIAINRDIVGRMLRELGHESFIVSNGVQALAMGREQTFDLVLLDIRMPEMDGLEVTRRWRAVDGDQLDPETPIFALTANAMMEERERALEAGMQGYLSKPVSLEKLAGVLGLAAKMQLVRGKELSPNFILQRPMLDLSEEQVAEKLRSTLLELADNIDAAWKAQRGIELQHLLHVVQGCAGQSRRNDIRLAAERLEIELRQGAWPEEAQIKRLRWHLEKE
ncbi:two component system sensor kinase [Chromobacterium sp. Panama]|uniref:two component system sensor kinase n=1 Tax=Chromobacterium sp. Panama TaxID=2161826 RepID=UPI000D3233DC|nr:two component system sensor kinase [Chromobacterium sp. Panama]PTU63376.1 two component system sensor kinase [Chromobacterium sp. Panama]